MKSSEQVNEISKALSFAQGEMSAAKKSSKNPFFKSKYADFSSVWDAIREPLRKYEIAVLQDVTSCEVGIAISTRLSHSSGQWFEFGPLEIPLTKKDAQSVGSGISYGKRYALSAAVGVVCDEEDDDAESVMERKSKNELKTPIVQQAKPIEVVNEKKISEDQVKEITQMLSEFDEGYQEKIWLHLGSKGITEWKDVSIKIYDDMKKAFQKRREQSVI